MINYPIEKYHFYNKGTTTIAVSSYCGRIVRGTAKTDPRDNFDPEFGKDLAAARCNAKIAHKREARALKKMEEAQEALIAATAYLEKMRDYYEDSVEAAKMADKGIENLRSML